MAKLQFLIFFYFFTACSSNDSCTAHYECFQVCYGASDMALSGLVCVTVVAVSGCIYWQMMVAVVSLAFRSVVGQAGRVQ